MTIETENLKLNSTTGTRSLHISIHGPYNFFEVQEIKNKVWGEEALAIIIFPPQSELATGPLLHLWKVEKGTVPLYSDPYSFPNRYPGAPRLALFGGECATTEEVKLLDSTEGNRRKNDE